MEAPLYRYDDVYDVAADAVRCIDARLERRGLQLEPAAGEALRTALEGVLCLAEVELRPDCIAIEEAMAEAA